METKRLINVVLLVFFVTVVVLSSCKKDKDEDTTQDNPVDVKNKGEFKDDRDNNIYKWIRIGNQIWMAENLAYIGNDIQHITDAIDWKNNSDNDGWCYYDNKTSNNTTYRVLYQWNAAKIACPKGWHLPKANEWTQLEDFLKNNGYSYDGVTGNPGIAKALATDNGWATSIYQGAVGNSDFTDFQNKTGFSALPGGFRNFNGDFNDIVEIGYWWSNTINNSMDAYGRFIDYDNSEVSSFSNNKLNGYSVRCIKD
jgi:uncharacterized protein (TIGR02145 family)